jgi:hypothetical protein
MVRLLHLRTRTGDLTAFTKVDLEDGEWANRYRWRLHSDGYAVRTGSWCGRPRTVYLHREIARPRRGEVVDHINGDPLDNRRSNLRRASTSENNANSADRPRMSGYRGVYWHEPSGKWVSQISRLGNLVHLGLYESVEEAARAYDQAARELHGAFARTNGYA